MINEKMLSYASELVQKEDTFSFDKVQYLLEVASSMVGVNEDNNKEVIDNLICDLGQRQSTYINDTNDTCKEIALNPLEKAYVFLYHMSLSYSMIIGEFKSIVENQRRRLYE